jgi:cold shock CspA family protein
MQFEGVLVAWNPEAGVGTLKPRGGGDDVFVGLGAFPMDGDGPRLDEAYRFEIVSSREGRKQAVHLKRLAPAAAPPAALRAAGGASSHYRAAQKKRRLAVWAGAVLAVALLLGGAWLGWPQPAGEVPAAQRR